MIIESVDLWSARPRVRPVHNEVRRSMTPASATLTVPRGEYEVLLLLRAQVGAYKVELVCPDRIAFGQKPERNIPTANGQQVLGFRLPTQGPPSIRRSLFAAGHPVDTTETGPQQSPAPPPMRAVAGSSAY